MNLLHGFVRWILLPLVAIVLLLVAGITFLSEGTFGERHGRGEIAREPIPAEAVAARDGTRATAAARLGAPTDRQILFGDLHVHTTYSGDAFVFSLPLFQGEGVHPPADACDFARFCAELDFWSINDHAESLTPWQWSETKEAIRECNAVAGDPANPDLVSFLGWEWTQSSTAPPEEDRPHFGHKNVILRDTDDAAVPVRPIGAGAGGLFNAPVPATAMAGVRLCYDMTYKLREPTPFVAWVRANGASDVVDGLGMLVEQAAESFRLWRGVMPPTAGILSALKQA